MIYKPMHKLYITTALLMSLVLGTGFAITGNSVFAQSYNDQSYGDSSYSSDRYSKYPTQDNKYVCQRGPFEGFYVSSVEFCKPDFDDKKFDDKKDRHDDVKDRDRAVPICEICFRDNLTPQQLLAVQEWLNTELTHNIGGYCSVIDLTDEDIVRAELLTPQESDGSGGPGLPQDVIDKIIECLQKIVVLNPTTPPAI
jgi:hypothetical protein